MLKTVWLAVANATAAVVVGGATALSPRWRGALAGLAGALAYRLGIRRAVALANLRLAFSELAETERHRIARRAYANLMLTVLDGLASTRLSRAELVEQLDWEGWPAFEAAIAQGRGVLMATAHLGSWELFGAALAQRMALCSVVRPLKGAFNARLVDARRHSGMRPILQRGALMGMMKALRRGEVVAQLVDQSVPARQGVFVPFFGQPTSTTQALSLVAQRTGAPVFALVSVREGQRLKVLMEGPIPVASTGDRRRDVGAHVAQVTAIIERFIRCYPEQWLWLHRRWKVQPPGQGAPAERRAGPPPKRCSL